MSLDTKAFSNSEIEPLFPYYTVALPVSSRGIVPEAKMALKEDLFGIFPVDISQKGSYKSFNGLSEILVNGLDRYFIHDRNLDPVLSPYLEIQDSHGRDIFAVYFSLYDVNSGLELDRGLRDVLIEDMPAAFVRVVFPLRNNRKRSQGIDKGYKTMRNNRLGIWARRTRNSVAFVALVK